MFLIFTYGEYWKLGFQKSEIFKHLSKTGISKIRDFQHPCFRYSPIVNIENTDVWKSRISNICLVNIENWDLKKSEVFKHPCFRYSPIVNIENTDVWKSRISNICHLSSEYRKLRFNPIQAGLFWNHIGWGAHCAPLCFSSICCPITTKRGMLVLWHKIFQKQ